MQRPARKKLIKKLEAVRKSKVICYINSDRRSDPPVPGINTKLSAEAQPFFYEHLKKIGKVKQLDLLLYTRGGVTHSIMPLVQLIREFCDKFSVLIPYKAHSGGTLICLGADEIVMSRMGELSPIDPTTANQFNPRIVPNDPKSPQIGISVEDVTSFFELAKDKKVGLKEKEMLPIFQLLSDKVHPLALGNVYRVYSQIRFLAKQLLRMHLKKTGDAKIEVIVETFAKMFYSHDYFITYKEAVGVLGNRIVKKAKSDEEESMWEIFQSYSSDLELINPFNVRSFIGDDKEKKLTIKGAYIESESLTHCFITKAKITTVQNIPPNVHVQVQPGQEIPTVAGLPISVNFDVLSQNWEKV